MYEEAVAERREAVALSGGRSYYKGLLGHTYAISGKREEAQAIIAELKSAAPQPSRPALSIAIVYTGLRDRNKAFEWLERTYQQRNSYLVEFFRVNPMFQSLHADPRFPDLLLRIGFPQ